MKYQTIASVSIFVCVLLLMCMGYILIVREPPRVVVIQSECPKSVQKVDAMPIYPKNNPSYPLRGRPSDFQQIGTLTSKNDAPPLVLPLFGKPIDTRKDRWEYYTTTDNMHMIRVPVTFENRDCSDEVGCREIYDKDVVLIPAYKKEFTVTLYKLRDYAYTPN